MVLMALDHARAFLCKSNGGYEIWVGRFTQYHGDLFAFLTRFVSHLCAPGFFFLLGCGMIFLVESRKSAGWSRSRIYLYFVKRGFLLIACQFLLENSAWTIGFGQMPLYFGVLFALGCALVLSVLFLKFPWLILGLSGLFLIVITELLLPQTKGYLLYPIHLRLLILPGFTHGAGMFVLYPVIPWLGVALLGMAFGKYVNSPKRVDLNRFFYPGVILILLFFTVRVNSGFGNIRMSDEGGVIGFSM